MNNNTNGNTNGNTEGNQNQNNVNNQLEPEFFFDFVSPHSQMDFAFQQLFDYSALFRMSNYRNRPDDELLLFWPPSRQRNEQPQSPRYSVDEFIRQKNQHLEKYMQKRTTPICNQELNKDEPYIKVSVLRNMNYPNTNHSLEYFINQLGLIGSQKNTDSEDIIIGRSHRNDINPNDIMLPEDRIISRIHCKIDCKNFFRKHQILEPLYQSTLKHIQLPKIALNKVSQFLEEPKHAYVQDLVSMCGTQIKIFKNDPSPIKVGQKYIIGSDTSFIIQFCEPYNPKGQYIDPQFFILLRKLNLAKQNSKHEVHFSDGQLLQKLRSIVLENEQTDEKKEEEAIYTKLKQYRVPITIIKFQGQGVEMGKNYNIFIGSETQDSNEFLIGRGQENHVKINSNTISRKQSRFRYLMRSKQWVIFDGTKDRDSANGTWVSLSTLEQTENKQESDKIELKHNSEIKISEFILKIELFQGKKHKKIDNQLLNELLNY